MAEKKWRFPDNGYTNENGLDTSDMEMFKKDPVSSLAREICQNSIDASSGGKPVKVAFSLFEIAREHIPGIDDLTKQIENCYEYKKGSDKERPSLEKLVQSIKAPTISCLRASDFNTIGACGVEKREESPFYNLTKGSGISDKGGSSGGSKGIGKFASFVVSTTNTVFYSTRAMGDKSPGYIGISKLRSAPISGKDPDLLTMGIGYYGLDDKNSPILEEFNLDKNFKRGEEYGTDVYIVGFNAMKGWQSNIVAKVLESFMVAIMRGKLEVVIDKIEVNKNTVKEIIYSDSFQKEHTKTELRDIRAQFELLQDDKVTVNELQIDGDNYVTVYLKQYTQQDEANATKYCVMIRYPYMKITHMTSGAYLPFSALCIIPDNELNKKLRAIENPQHTDWEIKRLNDFPEERRITRKLKKALENTVKEFIRNELRESSGESTDIEGAGEFLPSQDKSGMVAGNSTTSEQVRINPISLVKPQNPKTKKAGESGEGYDFTEGDLTDLGDEGKKPDNTKPNGPQPNPNPKPEPRDEAEIGSGNASVLKKVALSGMRFRNVVTDKTGGKYDCIFISQYDENDCEFAIRLCGEAEDKYPVEIVAATIDDITCEIKEGKIVGMQIKKGKTHKISYSVRSSEMFASEVIMSAYRK